MKINLKTGNNFSEEQLGKISHAAFLLERVFNSQEFQDEVINYKRMRTVCTGFWRWKKCETVEDGKGFYWDGNGRTLTEPNQVLGVIFQGAEELSPVIDGEADINIDLGQGRAVGYTYANSPWQWINQWFLDSASAADIAGNIAHEYMHKLGFSHAYRSHDMRQHTVPYAIGYIVNRLAKEHTRLNPLL